MRQSTLRRRGQVLEAAAKASILVDPDAYRNPAALERFWKDRFLPSRHDLRAIGGKRGIRTRLEKGSIHLGKHPLLNEEFIFGLRLSGAVTHSSGDSSRAYAAKPIAELLIQDIKEAGVPFEVKMTANGYTRITRCPLLLWLGCAEVKALPAAVAGLLAGARLVRVKFEAWLELPCEPLTEAYLNRLMIPFQQEPDNLSLRVSPYFGALFAPYMPDHLAARLLAVAPPVAKAPLMAAAYFELVAGRRTYNRTIPAATALPYGCAYATFFAHGYTKDSLIWRGRQECGILGMSPDLVRVTNDWIEAYFALRGDGEVPLAAIREHIKHKYFPAQSAQP